MIDTTRDRKHRWPSAQFEVLVAALKPEDFAPSETSQKLTDEQVRAIINMTHERAIYALRANQWSPEQEASYFMGALAVFFACGMADAIPKLWLSCAPEGILARLAAEKAGVTANGVLDANARKERRNS